jgi:hypothetical protein
MAALNDRPSDRGRRATVAFGEGSACLAPPQNRIPIDGKPGSPIWDAAFRAKPEYHLTTQHEANIMADRDLTKIALAAGHATSTLDEDERREAEALMASEPEFAAMVASFRKSLAEEGSNAVSEKLWREIESNLTRK